MVALRNLEAVDAYSILFARLKWPPPYVRLRVAKEIARCLADPKTTETARKAFLASLSTLELESEAVSYLDIIRAFNLAAYFSEPEVRRAVSKPSILSEVLIEKIFNNTGHSTQWKRIHNNRTPKNFIEPDYFMRQIDGYVVPLVYKSNFERLQNESGFPVVKHWAYEWTKLMEGAQYPHSGTPHYFLGGYSEQNVAPLDVRQREVILSAYLKTLSFAADSWRMPPSLCATVALNVISLNDGLAQMEPITEPEWCSEICKKVTNKAHTDEISSILRECMAQDHKRFLAQFHIPTFGEENLKRDITVRSFLFQPGDCEPASEQLAKHFQTRCAVWVENPIRFIGELDFEDPDEFRERSALGVTLPITLAVFPCYPGRWNQMYFQVGVHLPAAYVTQEVPSVAVNEMGLSISSGGEEIGKWHTWNKNWSPEHVRDGDPNVGTYSELALDVVDAAQEKFESQVCYIVRCRTWERERDYGEYKLREEYSLIRVPS